MRRRQTIIPEFTPPEMPSPALGFVSAFVPTYIQLQEARRAEELERELTATELLAKQLLEREKRQAILSTPIAQALTAFMRQISPAFPEIPAGIYTTPEIGALTTMMTAAAGLQRAQLQAQTRLQIEMLRNKIRDELQTAQTQKEFVNRMKKLHDMTMKEVERRFPIAAATGVLPTNPQELLEYRQLMSAAEAYRQSAEEGKFIPPQQWEIRKREVLDRLIGVIPITTTVEEVVPVTPTLTPGTTEPITLTPEEEEVDRRLRAIFERRR